MKAQLLGIILTPILGAQSLFDAPDVVIKKDKWYVEPTSYREALKSWKSVEEINLWIKNSFSYDRQKALKISEADNEQKPLILSPEEFYVTKSGICVDLARFAYEVMHLVMPEVNSRYLMIEFEPIREGKSLLRRHWLVLYEKDGNFYSFADSKRPGFISPSYKTLAALVDDYEKYRGRKILSYQALDTYEKQRAKKQKRMKRQLARPL